MDGKHIVLQAPVPSGTDYFNYKSHFSIVLFALVDANYNFIFADVGVQGRISDGGVFKHSQLCKMLEAQTLNLPTPSAIPGIEKELPFVFVADEAFPLNDNIMKPYSGNYGKGSMERIFNYRLSRARKVVENVFGISSSVFRVLRKPMLLEPEKAQVIVMAIVHLHNFLRKSKASKNKYTPHGSLDREVNGSIVEGTWREAGVSTMNQIRNIPRGSTLSSKDIRDTYAQYFMTTGCVPWQNDYA